MGLGAVSRWREGVDTKALHLRAVHAGFHANVRSGGQLSKRAIKAIFQWDLAERVGFEPTVRFPAHTLSKRAP
jgi:hypothetical protein